jgi:hypothetical protein
MASRTPGAETPHHAATPSNKRNRWDEVSLDFTFATNHIYLFFSFLLLL